ncbi:hypothetical protein HELRODRAFT_170653 [Helobdella robusta]|uniref:Uncharacterized protein n=1 Tax=Helobdella robusta TaxID=6412 RepID=T1F3A6_HELRO|nr:hypothetical protein HELRODRAFT_170653 [Helobdella robusta]ESO07323.1 hypothetical protein HELRODRAFT_170653 [Helobdella robusta]
MVEMIFLVTIAISMGAIMNMIIIGIMMAMGKMVMEKRVKIISMVVLVCEKIKIANLVLGKNNKFEYSNSSIRDIHNRMWLEKDAYGLKSNLIFAMLSIVVGSILLVFICVFGKNCRGTGLNNATVIRTRNNVIIGRRDQLYDVISFPPTAVSNFDSVIPYTSSPPSYDSLDPKNPPSYSKIFTVESELLRRSSDSTEQGVISGDINSTVRSDSDMVDGGCCRNDLLINGTHPVLVNDVIIPDDTEVSIGDAIVNTESNNNDNLGADNVDGSKTVDLNGCGDDVTRLHGKSNRICNVM